MTFKKGSPKVWLINMTLLNQFMISIVSLNPELKF